MAERDLTVEQALRCGIGKGRNCCAYLTVDGGGFRCHQNGSRASAQRRSALADAVAIGRTVARLPVRAFPDCQNEGWLP